MKSSTKDQAEGTFHELKGKVKEIAGKLSDNRSWKRKAPVKRSPAKFRERSARSRRYWGSSGNRMACDERRWRTGGGDETCYGP